MAQWYCVAQGDRYGPVAEDQLRLWIHEGRLKPSDLVWREGMGPWTALIDIPELSAARVGGGGQVSQPRAMATATAPGVRPHRAVAVLVLGILGVASPWCFICGIIGWVMGHGDLKDMEAGRMDRSGYSMTKAGKICGIIGACVGIFWAVMMVIYFAFWLTVIGNF